MSDLPTDITAAAIALSNAWLHNGNDVVVARAETALVRRAEEAASELERLQAEVERLRKDAERYGFIKDKRPWGLLKYWPAPRPYEDAAEVLDEAIDAAMQQEQT